MGQILGTTVNGTALRRPLGNVDRRMAFVVAAVLVAAAIGATAWSSGVMDAGGTAGTVIAPALGNADDHALRHAVTAPGLSLSDDFATRHVPAAGLGFGDDFGTRHAAAVPGLGEQDDYGTRSR